MIFWRRKMRISKPRWQEVQEQLDTLTTGNTSIIAQYQSLIWVLQSYRTGDMVSAAKTFAESQL